MTGKDFFEGYKTSKVVIEQKRKEWRQNFADRVRKWGEADWIRSAIRFIQFIFTHTKKHSPKNGLPSIEFDVEWQRIWTVKERCYQTVLIDDKGNYLATNGLDTFLQIYDLNPEAASWAMSRLENNESFYER